MKKTLIFFSLSFLVLSSFQAQSWRYKTVSNVFDGNYRFSYVNGVGNNFPYKTPSLILRKYDIKEDVDLYINGAGYFQSGTNVEVRFVFSDEPNIIYYCTNFNYSTDGKALFLESFSNPQGKISKMEFIKKLKHSNKITIRASDRYGLNDMTFSLSGSTKAINFIIPESKMNLIINEFKQKKIEEEKLKNQKTAIVDKLIKILETEKVKDITYGIKSRIEEDLGLYSWSNSNWELYDSIKIVADSYLFESYGYVDIFYVLKDGSEEEIIGNFKVLDDAPIYKRVEQEKIAEEKRIQQEKIAEEKRIQQEKIAEEKRIQQEKIAEEKRFKKELERISLLVRKYKNPELEREIIERITKEIKLNKNRYSIENIQNVFVNFASVYRGLSTLDLILITKIDGNTKEWQYYLTPTTLINKKYLKSLGLRSSSNTKY